jgi:alkyl hydroperoxide reductase subunit AhpF
MPMLSDQIRSQLRERFTERLVDQVQLKLYIKPGSGRLILPSGLGCATCDDARALTEELQQVAPEKISLEVVDVTSQPSANGTEVPLLTVGLPDQEHRIRFLGLPAGYEFATVVDAVERVSRREPGLSPASLERLAALTEATEVMVFATPT